MLLKFLFFAFLKSLFGVMFYLFLGFLSKFKGSACGFFGSLKLVPLFHGGKLVTRMFGFIMSHHFVLVWGFNVLALSSSEAKWITSEPVAKGSQNQAFGGPWIPSCTWLPCRQEQGLRSKDKKTGKNNNIRNKSSS